MRSPRRRPTDGLTEEQIRQALAGFVGEIDQVPSAVSAIKVDGRRAYDRVRAGEQVELASRRVTVEEIAVRAVRGDEVDISVRCSSGTYIRAIARDLGERLGVGGHLVALRRTAVGPFSIDDAHTLEELADELVVLPIEQAARKSFPALDLDEDQATDVGFGRKLELQLGHDGPVALFATGRRLPRALRAGRGIRPGSGRLRLTRRERPSARGADRSLAQALANLGSCVSGVPWTTCPPTSAEPSWSSATSTASTSGTGTSSAGPASSPTATANGSSRSPSTHIRWPCCGPSTRR